MRSTVFLLLVCLMLNTVSGCVPKPYSESRFIMDTLVRIEAYGRGAPNAVSDALDEMARIEALMSSHIPTSDVSRLNAAAGKHPVEVSDETALVLREALRVSRLSGGAFDVTVGPLVEVWGIGGEEQRVPSSGELERAVQLVDYQNLSLEGNAAFLEVLGMGVDLGAIAKGYAVDRAVQVLADSGIASALLDAGGNVFVLGNRPDGEAWRVGIRHPRRTDDALAILEAKDLTVVTSGDYQRYFVQDGIRYHHIFDTSTGYPARGVISATVVSRSSMEADALSTAIFVMGPKDGLALIESLDGFEALIVDQEGEVSMTPGLQPVKLNP